MGYQGQSAKLGDQIAAFLSQNGFTVVRFAKRGFEDPNELPRQTASFLIQDLQDALLHFSGAFRTQSLHLIGFSEGALMALHAIQDPATQNLVRSVHLLSLPTQPIDESLRYQFSEWPTLLLQARVNRAGIRPEVLEATELSLLPNDGQIPLLGALMGDATKEH